MNTDNNKKEETVFDNMETDAEKISEVYERQSRRYSKNLNSENEVK